jgi:glycosyltransferase involved in cell wall biosynthesis
MTATSIRRESIRAGERVRSAGVRVGVDARSLAAPRGIARYTAELLRALAHEHPGDRWLLFVPGRDDLEVLDELRRAPNVSVHRHPLPGRVLFGAAALAGRPRLDRLIGAPLDLVWAPAPAPVAFSGRVPLVLTVQDLSFELRPEDFTAYERLWHLLARPRSLARSARRLIVSSESTRTQVMSRWGIPADRVQVVEMGVRLPAAGGEALENLRRFGLEPHGYLLAVGALEPRKAPDLLVRAFRRARERGLRAELVFAGEGRLGSRLQAPGVRLLGRVSDAELHALYGGALALVVASLLEGYGLPVREALARGTPAVVSDLPVFGPELSGGLLRFPVGNEPALTSSLLQLVGDQSLRQRLAAGARNAVSGLTWESAARATRAVLAEALTPAGDCRSA